VKLWAQFIPLTLLTSSRSAVDSFATRKDAEDAAAEVFLKLHAVLEKKNQKYPFRSWVCQVAGRHCIDKLRRRKREKRWIVAGNNLCALSDVFTPSPLSQVLHNEAKRQVSEQLSRRPDHYKVPLLLRYYKRMSYSEIARTLNRRLSAIKTTIFRAKNRLRRNLGRSPRCTKGPSSILQHAENSSTEETARIGSTVSEPISHEARIVGGRTGDIHSGSESKR
jgi:RNA polymerase sigma-70 factor (ECF subfamily)